MTPDVITDFLPRALHVSHKDGLPRAVEVIPANPGNFLLPTCRKESERDYFWHGNRVITPSPHVEVMLHQLVQLIKRRPAIAFFALSDHSELSQYLSSVSNGKRIYLIAPGRPSNRSTAPRCDRSFPTVCTWTPPPSLPIRHCANSTSFWLFSAESSASPSQVSLIAVRVARLVFPSGRIFSYSSVLVDHLLDCHTLAVRTFDSTWRGKLRFPTLDPRLSHQLAVEGLAFLINCLPVPIDPNLRRVSRRIVLALA